VDLEEVKQAIRDIETDACHQDRFYYKKCMEFLLSEIEECKAELGRSWLRVVMEAFK
jgi:hypothetical protein